MGIFVYLNRNYQQQQIIMSGQPISLNVDDPHEFIGNPPLLAPHGVPTNAKWQTKMSPGLTGTIKEDQVYVASSVTIKPVNIYAKEFSISVFFL